MSQQHRWCFSLYSEPENISVSSKIPAGALVDVCVAFYYVPTYPGAVDVHETAGNRHLHTHLSSTMDPDIAHYTACTYAREQNINYREEHNRFNSGGTLSKALLFVCSAGRREEESKHVNPLTNISSCLIYISVLNSPILFFLMCPPCLLCQNSY